MGLHSELLIAIAAGNCRALKELYLGYQGAARASTYRHSAAVSGIAGPSRVATILIAIETEM